MGIILFLVAWTLVVTLLLPAILHLIAGSLRFKGGFKYINESFFAGAWALDVFGNMAYSTFLNDFFLKKGGYHYGVKGETISSATGKNWVKDTLTFMGKGLAGTLNLIDRGTAKIGGHCWVYIDGDRREYDRIGHPGKINWHYTACFIAFSLLVLASTSLLTLWITRIIVNLF